MRSVNFSVIIPCFNEEPAMPLLVEGCKRIVSIPTNEVLFVNNGSSDATSEVLKKLVKGKSGFRVIDLEVNRGYGGGILAGLYEAHGEVLAWTHADLQTNPEDVLRALSLFGSSNQQIFVKGRRVGRPLSDATFTLGMSVFETLLLRHKLWDINAQPTLFHRSFFESWVEPPCDFSLDLYAYSEAVRQGMRVERINVRFGSRPYGQSHWNINWSQKFRFIRRTVEFSLALRKRERACKS